MERLVDAFNPAAAAGVMCRNTLSVGWDGTLYDCDFNQMLDLPRGRRRAAAHPRLRLARARDARRIVTGQPLLRLHRRRGLVLRRHRDLRAGTVAEKTPLRVAAERGWSACA